MPLSANLFRLESSILTRVKRAINRNNEAGNYLNVVEHEPVPSRVLNPNASEASYKPKQRSYRRTNLKKNVLTPNSPGAEMSGAELSSAETYPTPFMSIAGNKALTLGQFLVFSTSPN